MICIDFGFPNGFDEFRLALMKNQSFWLILMGFDGWKRSIEHKRQKWFQNELRLSYLYVISVSIFCLAGALPRGANYKLLQVALQPNWMRTGSWRCPYVPSLHAMASWLVSLCLSIQANITRSETGLSMGTVPARWPAPVTTVPEPAQREITSGHSLPGKLWLSLLKEVRLSALLRFLRLV